MGQRGNYASVKDAQIMLKKEECALGTGQRSNDAAVKGAQIMLFKEEYASSMVQRRNNAATKGAQIMLRKEVCVGDTGQTALLMTYPLLLGQNSMRLLHLSIYPISAILVLQTKEVLVYLQK